MNLLKIKIDPKTEECIPYYATPGSSGLDLKAHLDRPVIIVSKESALISTGLRLEIPHGHEGQIRSRSGLAVRHGVFVLNSPGTIDADYRGEVNVILYNAGRSAYTVENGDRIAQLVFSQVQHVELEVSTLSDTSRGSGGFGSTGV